jgi:hypothetical protein
VTLQKVALSFDGVVVAVEEGLVVPAWHPNQFAVRGVVRGPNRRLGEGRLVAIADHDQ